MKHLLARNFIAAAAFATFLLPGLNAADRVNEHTAPIPVLKVAAAADLQFALGDLIKEFNATNVSSQVSATYGSSGNFFTQLQNGAPFDLFLSADIQYPRKMAEVGLTSDDVFSYAMGRLVVWVPKESPVDVTALGIKALLAPSIHKIAIANPEHAPYGRAAVEALKSLKVYEQVQSKLVYGENIAQTAQFVQSGAADIGIVALSLALAPKMIAAGRYWEVPPDAYPRMEQGGVILKSTKDIASARAFRDFLLGQQGREALKRYGFSLPEK